MAKAKPARRARGAAGAGAPSPQGPLRATRKRHPRLDRYKEADDPEVRARMERVLNGRTIVQFVKDLRDELEEESEREALRGRRRSRRT